MMHLDFKVILTQAIAFVLLVLLLRKFLFGRVLDVLDERRNAIQADFDRMEENRRSMEAARSDYMQRLANIEAEARERIQSAVKEAQTLRDQIVTDARSQGEQLVTRATEEIQREKQKALVELRTEVADLAVGAASKILGRSIDAQAHRDLLQGVIDDVGRA